MDTTPPSTPAHVNGPKVRQDDNGFSAHLNSHLSMPPELDLLGVSGSRGFLLALGTFS